MIVKDAFCLIPCVLVIQHMQHILTGPGSPVRLPETGFVERKLLSSASGARQDQTHSTSNELLLALRISRPKHRADQLVVQPAPCRVVRPADLTDRCTASALHFPSALFPLTVETIEDCVIMHGMVIYLYHRASVAVLVRSLPPACVGDGSWERSSVLGMLCRGGRDTHSHAFCSCGGRPLGSLGRLRHCLDAAAERSQALCSGTWTWSPQDDAQRCVPGGEWACQHLDC